ncbi:MAG: pilus assembly protein PilM [Deltaproteobacteria bacterium]|nr:pilus assembly protein PilM [Deltaproteobacteria bacterium]MBW2359902.1 pilus assembly protein PilM [Deltaproteobacteria bacterium]
MPVLRNVLGLDLGSHSLKAVEFRQSLRSCEAVQLRSLPRPDSSTALPELLQRFVQLHRLPTDQIVTALPGDQLSSRRLSFPFAERRRLAAAVPFALEDQMPFELEDVVMDWSVVAGDRSHAEVLAVIAPRGEVSALLEELDGAGCAPRTLEAEGLVLGNLCAVFDLPGRRLLVDLGHRKTSFCLLVDEQAVAARSVPVGGAAITEALAADRGLSLADAERAKCEEGVFGSSLDQVGPQTGKALDRIARELVRTLGSIEEWLGGAPLDELTLFGGGALLDRIDTFLADRSGVPAARLPLPREGHGNDLVAGGPPILYAPAIALGLRGTARARTAMNFRQDEFAVRMDVGRVLHEFRQTAWLAAAVVALALFAFGTGTFLDARQAAAIEQRAEKLWIEAFANDPVPHSVATGLREKIGEARERADFLGVYRGNLSALDLLVEISKRVPQNLDIALEDISIDRQSVRMRVKAKNFEAADRLGAELQSFEPFASTKIGSIETDSRTGSKRFSVTISLKPPEARP